MKKLLALAVLAVTILLVQPTGTASSAPAAPTAVQPPNGSRIESFRPTLCCIYLIPSSREPPR